jgi:hypothetical protein
MNICVFYQFYVTRTLLNNVTSMTRTGLLNNMNQQLAAIAAGIKDLPGLLAESIVNAQPAPSASNSSISSSKPRVELLPQLDRNDYPMVATSWFQEPYLGKRKNGKAKLEEDEDAMDSDDTKVSITSCYMVDENGEQLPETDKDAARCKARGFWNQLFREERAPPKLSGACLDVVDEYILVMEKAYPWLRLCANHWKSLQIWRNHYTGWYRAAKRRAEEAAKKAAEEAAKKAAEEAAKKAAAEGMVIDVDATESDSQDDNLKGKRHQRGAEEANDPKRRRVEDPEPASPSRPVPATITSKRRRVCTPVPHNYILR